jgi:hypothetical protein
MRRPFAAAANASLVDDRAGCTIFGQSALAFGAFSGICL